MFLCCCSEDRQEVEILAPEALATQPEIFVSSEKPLKDVASENPLPELTKYNPNKDKQHEHPTFLVNLEAPDTPDRLGLQLDLSDGETAYILHVSQNQELPAQRWNASVKEEHRKLTAGVYIVEINGTYGGPKLMDLVQSGSALSMLCRKPSLRRVKVKRGGNTNLGLDLQFAKKGRVLTVTKILEGAVKEAGVEILPGDRILEVDGIQGPSEELLKTLSESLNPTLVLSRCPEVTTAYAMRQI